MINPKEVQVVDEDQLPFHQHLDFERPSCVVVGANVSDIEVEPLKVSVTDNTSRYY